MSMFGDVNKLLSLFREAHQTSDVDNEASSLHHTLGRGPTQAARGNHRHIGMVITYATIPPVGTLELDGSVINYADYPEYFRFLGLSSGTYTLPDFTGGNLAVVVK